jgi:flavorubredoxin
MASAPRQKPLEVAEETFLIRALTASIGGTWTNLNSMVIRSADPVVIDTGMATHRETWFEDVFSLVPPERIRWIFLSHMDTDHAGNLAEALTRCPNARVVTSRGESFRLAAFFQLSLDRLLMLDQGQSFPVGDRVLRSLRPPVYDSPYTRGLLDTSTGVYYASDAFCAPNPVDAVDRVDQMSPEFWAEGMRTFHHLTLCPWVALLDSALFRAEVDRFAALEIKALLGAHTPAILGSSVPTAFEQLASLPDATSPRQV